MRNCKIDRKLTVSWILFYGQSNPPHWQLICNLTVSSDEQIHATTWNLIASNYCYYLDECLTNYISVYRKSNSIENLTSMVSWHYWWNVYKMAIDWCVFGMLYTKWYPLMQWQMYMYLSYAMYSAWYTQPIRSTWYPGEWYYFIIYQCILCLKTISPKTVFYEEKTNFIARLDYAFSYLLHSKHSCVSS